MRKEDREFKTIFFIWGYHLYVTIPLRNKSSFMFRVIECGKDCKEIEIYLKDYLKYNKVYLPHSFNIRDKLTVILENVKESNIIDWKVIVKRKRLAYMNKWKKINLGKVYKDEKI